MKYKEVLQYAKEKDSTLMSGKDFIGTSTVRHNDGTVLILEFSCYEEKEGWLIFFTEHHGLFVYHTDDMDWKFEKY